MRNIIVLLVLLSSLTITAQKKKKKRDRKETKLGLRAGLNNVNISNTPNTARYDFYVGLFLDITETDYYKLTPELIYSGQGNKKNVNSNRNVDIDYLSIGLANKFYPIKNSEFHLVIGPTIDVKLNQMPIFNNNYKASSPYYDFMIFDVTLFLGVAYHFKSGLGIETRYKQGFLDVYGNNLLLLNNTSSTGAKLNRVFQIGITYQF